ncbi:unnamed protein product, partial [Phaeothamnion confervicola]
PPPAPPEPELPPFTELESPHEHVSRFLCAAMRRMLPPELLGTRNMRLLLWRCDDFVRLGRFERMSLEEAIRGMRPSDIAWMGRAHTAATVGSSLLCQLVAWVFSDMVVPLLQASFYITDCESAARMAVHYFRKPAWGLLHANALRQLTKVQFQSVPAAARLLSLPPSLSPSLPCSVLRLLPKATGVRAIVNMSKRAPRVVSVAAPVRQATSKRQRLMERTKSLPSANSVLAGAFSVLKYERRVQPVLGGAGVIGVDEVGTRLAPTAAPSVAEAPATTASAAAALSPQLYFASVDVQHCFDTIDAARVVALVRSLLSHDEYLLQKHGVVHPMPSMDRLQVRYIQEACALGDFAQFSERAAKLAGGHRGAVFTDSVLYSKLKKADLMALLEEHLFRHVVRVPGGAGRGAGCGGSEMLRQVAGIPQGSVLSVLLCNFYYGQIERDLL